MNWWINPQQMTATIRHGHWWLLAGFLLFAGGLFSHHFVTMTGAFAIMLGASAIGFGRALLKPGMWFLALMIWPGTVLIYIVTSYLEIGHFIRKTEDVFALVCLAAATWLIGKTSRFLLTFIVLNRRMSRAAKQNGSIQVLTLPR